MKLENAGKLFFAAISPLFLNTQDSLNCKQFEKKVYVSEIGSKFNVLFDDDGSSGWNDFGVPRLRLAAHGTQNAIVGLADNGANPAACIPGASVCSYPTGITGMGTLTSTGNQAFGIYGVGKALTTGTATAAEFTSRNQTGQRADYTLPPDTAFSTTTVVPLAETLGCAGSSTCSLALRIVQDGAAPNSFENGIYVSPKSVLGYDLYFDSDGTNGALNPMMIRHTGKGTTIEADNLGSIVPTNSVFYSHNAQDGQSTTWAKVLQSGAFQNYWWTLDPKGKLTSQSNASYQAVTIHDFIFSGETAPEFEVADVGSATSGVQVRGGNVAAAPQVAPVGAASNIPLTLTSKGSSTLNLGVESDGNVLQLYSNGVASVGWLAKGAVNGNPAILKPQTGNTPVSLTGSGSGATMLGSATSPVKLTAMTVSNLPACNSTYQDAMYVVTDATAPTYHGTLNGSGSVRVPVYCDGVSWRSY